MRAVASMDEFKRLVGKEVALTEWTLISQRQVNLFAEATGDRQWIHVDVERSRIESPFGGTVAHGFLTLSLLPMWLHTAVSMPPSRLDVNYGLNKVRFPAPLLAGSRVRGRLTPLQVEDIPSGAQIIWKVEVECEGGSKPVCVAEWIVRRYE